MAHQFLFKKDFNINEVLDATQKYVKEKFAKEPSGHDWWHTYRVWKLSNKIAKYYINVNFVVVELAALLHDIDDWKFNDGDFSLGAKNARKWLETFEDLKSEDIDNVCNIIENISFKGIGAKKPILSLEGQIVQDADRIDAMGAIGIARTFTYGGHKGRLIHSPNIKPINHKTENSYVHRNSEGTSINHFYEKLLLIKDLMNTETGKIIAQERYDFMQVFLNKFYSEWEGEE